MKPHLFSFLAFAVLTASAHAWPFSSRNFGLSHQNYELSNPLAIQTDNDPTPELFFGGPSLTQTSLDPSGNPVATRTNLPAPDFDPYVAGVHPVTFGRGRGAAGDIDGDGDTDIIYTATLHYNGSVEHGNTRVVACRNDGNDNWTRLWQLKTLSAAYGYGSPEVELADFDRDGDLDFIETSNGAIIRWNDGNGTYSSSTTLISVLDTTPQMEVADFDGNGWPDVAVFSREASTGKGKLTLLRNQDGAFTAETIIAANTDLVWGDCGQADLNHDGKPDLLSVQSIPTNGFLYDFGLFWHRNTGDGFAAPALLYQNTLNGKTITFHPCDPDEDGVTDLFLSGRSGERKWLRGLGGATFQTIDLATSDSTADPVRHVVADMDRDGDPDIAVGHGGSWVENQSVRMKCQASAAAWNGVNPSGSVRLTSGDLNHDGRPDLVVADGGNSRIRWYAGSGGGLQAPVPVSTGNLQPISVTTGDFNRDGWTDLAWTTNNTLTQALNSNGSGLGWNFSTAAAMTGITDILAEDMDRDGDLDILSISPSQSLIRIHSNNGTAVNWLPQNVDTGINNLQRLTAGQLIPGGRPEILTLSSGFFINRHQFTNGSWAYGGAANSSGSTSSAAIVIAEIAGNLPGPETVHALSTNAIYYTHPTNSVPVLVGHTFYPVTRLAAVDWNRDGFMDILAATTDGVMIFPHARGAGGSFSAPIPLMQGTSMQDLVIMPLNGDAYPDAVASQTGTGQLHLITNTTAAVETLATAAQPVQTLLPGQSAEIINLVCRHNGLRTSEIRCAPAGLLFRFRRSNLVGGIDTPGGALTQVELNALINHVEILNGDISYQPSSPTPVTDGWYGLTLSNPTRQSLALGNNQFRIYQITVKLKTTAASAPVQRFYVEFWSGDNNWVELDAVGNSSPLPARKSTGSSTVSALLTVKTPAALENWRMTWFGQYDATGIAANDHDADGDGLPNLLEYAASRNPTSATGLSELANPLVLVTGAPGDHVTAEVRLLQSFDTKVRVRLQDSTTLQFWSNLSTRDGGGAWVGRTPTTTQLSGGRTLYKFNTNIRPLDEPKYFLRLHAEEIP